MLQWQVIIYFGLGFISAFLSLLYLQMRREPEEHERPREKKKTWDRIDTLSYATKVPMSWAEKKDSSYLIGLIGLILEQEKEKGSMFSVNPGKYDVSISVRANFVRRGEHVELAGEPMASSEPNELSLKSVSE